MAVNRTTRAITKDNDVSELEALRAQVRQLKASF